MAVYVDYARNRLNRMIMCHMVADTLTELHRMAHLIGMRRTWFQPASFPHYDVSLERRRLAVRLGAVEVGRHELVAIMRRFRETEEWQAHLYELRLSRGLTTSSPISTPSLLSGEEELTPLQNMPIRRPRPPLRKSVTG